MADTGVVNVAAGSGSGNKYIWIGGAVFFAGIGAVLIYTYVKPNINSLNKKTTT